MLTAVIPSVSAAKGYESVLTGVHNVSAPISALIMLIMETVQLTVGEHDFGHVLTQDNATVAFGPLTQLQRLRVVVLCMAWVAVAVQFTYTSLFLRLREAAVCAVRNVCTTRSTAPHESWFQAVAAAFTRSYLGHFRYSR